MVRIKSHQSEDIRYHHPEDFPTEHLDSALRLNRKRRRKKKRYEIYKNVLGVQRRAEVSKRAGIQAERTSKESNWRLDGTAEVERTHHE